MKTKEELIKKHEFKLDGRWALDRPDVEEIMDEYAEEYAKALLKHMGFADIEPGQLVNDFKESLKK